MKTEFLIHGLGGMVKGIRQGAMIIVLGAIATGTICYAQSDMARDNLKFGTEGNVKRNYSIKATESLHHIFQNLYHEPSCVKEKPTLVAHDYKLRLRSLLAVNFNENLQIGVDSFKSGPLAANKREIIPITAHLEPKDHSSPKTRGYGLEFRFKL